MQKKRILCIESDPALMRLLVAVLAAGYDLTCEVSAYLAIKLFEREAFDLVVSGHQFQEGMTGCEFFAELQQTHPNVGRILLGDSSSQATFVEAINGGNIHYILAHEWEPEELLSIVNKLLNSLSLSSENLMLQKVISAKNSDLEDVNRRLLASNSELAQVTQELRSVNEELEISNEELKTKVEELESANEELNILNEDIERKNILLENSNKHLESLDALKSNILANMSHELRTPLVSIRGYIELVMRDEICVQGNPAHEYLHIALTNVDKLVGLIDNLLDYSKLDKGEIAIDYKTLDLKSLLDDVVELHQPMASEKGIKIDLKTTADTLFISGDRRKLEQVFSHLIGNAIKFNHQDGRVTINMMRDWRNSILISISDTGIGIATENIPCIFDRFYQVESSSTRRFGGTGIGLSIVRDTIRLHGGAINVRSQVNKGSSFIISVPGLTNKELRQLQKIVIPSINCDPGSPMALDFPEVQGAATRCDNSDKLVLVVDDEFSITEYISDLLEANDYTVRTFASGRGALDFVAANPDQIAVVLLDIAMGVIDGFEVCRQIKNNPDSAQIVVYMLTAKSDEESIMRSFEAGADGFVLKPCKMDVLLDKVALATGRELKP